MPRPRLSTELVVAGAAELVDEVGHDGLTLTELAGRFGVAVPSLYKHVDGLDDLRRRLATVAVQELDVVLASAAEGKTKGEALHAVAVAYRDYAAAHPGRYAATQRAPDPDDSAHLVASEAVLVTMSRLLEGYGVAAVDAVDATRAIRSALHGFVDLEARGGFGLPQNIDRSFDRLIDVLDRALTTWA